MTENAFDDTVFTGMFSMYIMQADTTPVTYTVFQQPIFQRPPIPPQILPIPSNLQKWVFWLHYRTSPTSAGVLVKIASFQTFEELVRAQNSLDVQKLQNCVSVSFFCFKEGIKPDKMHAGNQDGGCWSAEVARGYRQDDSRAIISSWWATLMYAVIMEQIHPEPKVVEAVLGVRLSLRKQYQTEGANHKNFDRLELWTDNAGEPYIQYQLGMSMKTLLNIPTEITYLSHKDILQYSNQKWQHQHQQNTNHFYEKNIHFSKQQTENINSDRDRVVEFKVDNNAPRNSQNFSRSGNIYERQMVNSSSTMKNNSNVYYGSCSHEVVEVRLHDNNIKYENNKYDYNRQHQQYYNNRYGNNQQKDNRIITVYLDNISSRGYFRNVNVTRRGRFGGGRKKNQFLYDI